MLVILFFNGICSFRYHFLAIIAKSCWYCNLFSQKITLCYFFRAQIVRFLVVIRRIYCIMDVFS